MKKPPTITSVTPQEDNILFIQFSNGEKKKYDTKALLNKEMFSHLQNPAFFRSVKIDKGGYAIFWDKNTDISEYELWKNGTPVN